MVVVSISWGGVVVVSISWGGGGLGGGSKY